MFEKGTIDGYVVTAIDGTQTYNSDKEKFNGTWYKSTLNSLKMVMILEIKCQLAS